MALLSSLRAAGALVAAALAGGCGDLVRPPEFIEGDPDQLLVHAVLRAGSDSAAVAVSRAGTRAGAVPVHGAQVRLTGGGGEAVLPQAPQGAEHCVVTVFSSGDPTPQQVGCYRGAVPGGVRAGAEYRLEVVLPTGERAQGRTVVPLPPEVRAPADGVRVPARSTQPTSPLVADSLPAWWTGARPVSLHASPARLWSRAAAAPRCAVGLSRAGSGFQAGPLPPHMTEMDSVVVLLSVPYCDAGPGTAPLRLDSAEIAVGITAWDSAYLGYVRQWNNGIPAADAAAGLEGAWGLFGSSATAVRRVRLIPVP